MSGVGCPTGSREAPRPYYMSNVFGDTGGFGGGDSSSAEKQVMLQEALSVWKRKKFCTRRELSACLSHYSARSILPANDD